MRITSFVLALALSFSASPLFAARAGRVAQGQGATLSGTAQDSAGRTIARATVQLRDLATGQLAGTTQSAANGAFTFTGLPAGNYAVEVVNPDGRIIGSSAAITITAGATITGVAVSATAAVALGTAAGAAAAGAAAAGGLSTAVVVAGVAAAAGVAGAVVAANNDASPSR